MDGTVFQLPSPILPIQVQFNINNIMLLKNKKKVKLKGYIGFQYKSATRKKNLSSCMQVTFERQVLTRYAS